MQCPMCSGVGVKAEYRDTPHGRQLVEIDCETCGTTGRIADPAADDKMIAAMERMAEAAERQAAALEGIAAAQELANKMTAHFADLRGDPPEDYEPEY